MIPTKQTFASLVAVATMLCTAVFLPSAVAQQLTLQTVDGKQLQGTIDQIDEAGQVTGTGIGEGLTIDSIVSIETGKPVVAVSQRAQVYLAGVTAWGRAVMGADAVGIAKEQVSLTGRLGDFQLPLQAVSAIVWRDSETVQQAIANPSTELDRVIVDVDGTPQTVNGIVDAVTSESVSVNYKGKLRSIGVAKVNAIVLANVGYQAPSGVLGSLQTTDGSRFFGAIQSWAKASTSVSRETCD